jgi:hypothetical protein
MLKLRCNKHSAYREKPNPTFVEAEAPFINMYMAMLQWQAAIYWTGVTQGWVA